MSDVDRLLADYIAEHRAGGEADPRAYLSRASPAERRELAALIDAYLARAPRQPFDQASFRGSSAERTVDELERAIAGQAGLWPALLPRLRDRAGLKRSELVERLAAALGVERPQGQGRRLLPRDGAGPAPCPRRVRPGARGARARSSARPRRRSETPDARSTPPAEGPTAAPAAAFARRAYAEPASAASRGAPNHPRRASGTRSTSCSAAADVRFRPRSDDLPGIDHARRPRPSGARAPRRPGGRLAARRADRADAQRPAEPVLSRCPAGLRNARRETRPRGRVQAITHRG